ncbi:MAG: bifunctional hydroxymethylpyrimidine kinase/phosphomethylpyrimidine kinase [Vulcanimicrobiaceae bacterium]
MAETSYVNIPVVCSIGTNDPWNAAGVGLDIRVLAECNVRPVTVIAGIAAQDTRGLRASAAVEPALILAQLESLAGAGIAAYRVGALLDPASVTAIGEFLAGVTVPVVWDPVLAPSAGGRFASEATLAALRSRLLPRASLVMPNLAEAGALLGRSVQTVDEMERAARDLVAGGARAALVKGGHLDGDPVDVLFDGARSERFAGERIAGTMRGTGCVLAAATAAALARGQSLRASVIAGRIVLRKKLAGACSVGELRLAY